MNLIDNNRYESGLFFGSSVYAKDHVATSINHKLLPERRELDGTSSSLDIKRINPTIAVFANTVKSFPEDAYGGSYEQVWSINNFEYMVKAGLMPEYVDSGNIYNEDFFNMVDLFLDKCLVLNNNNLEQLSRLVSILMATNYISLELAYLYSSDDSFTEDMIFMLGSTVIRNKIIFNTAEECEYILQTVQLPKIYSEPLLGMR